MLSTKEKLAQKLHSLGLLDLEKRAMTGEFSDFESDHAMPKVELVYALGAESAIANPATYPLIREMIKEVKDGKWDDTKEESEAWFEREGKNLLL